MVCPPCVWLGRWRGVASGAAEVSPHPGKLLESGGVPKYRTLVAQERLHARWILVPNPFLRVVCYHMCAGSLRHCGEDRPNDRDMRAARALRCELTCMLEGSLLPARGLP